MSRKERKWRRNGKPEHTDPDPANTRIWKTHKRILDVEKDDAFNSMKHEREQLNVALDEQTLQEQYSVKLARLIQRSGYCARNNILPLLREHLVSVDGKTVTDPNTKVCPLNQVLVHDSAAGTNKEIIVKEPTMWACNKFRNEPMGEFLSRMRVELSDNAIPICPLDDNTRGIQLLTNDAKIREYVEQLTLVQTFAFTVTGVVNPKRVASIRRGANIDGIHYPKMNIQAHKWNNSHYGLLEVTDVKNRLSDIKRRFRAMHWEVKHAMRIRYGSWKKSTLPVVKVDIPLKWRDKADVFWVGYAEAQKRILEKEEDGEAEYERLMEMMREAVEVEAPGAGEHEDDNISLDAFDDEFAYGDDGKPLGWTREEQLIIEGAEKLRAKHQRTLEASKETRRGKLQAKGRVKSRARTTADDFLFD
eukprot:TRINITY_DN66884_c4_g1_i2.p1 TRINITY_DN66884_c4_g1~~TRINITY_DN66884_c4_g1_i2.p1  ORF type:complete len:444 (-),score=18.49 TRINITY_DN66884_c4_g1_i2:624-1877(-)